MVAMSSSLFIISSFLMAQNCESVSLEDPHIFGLAHIGNVYQEEQNPYEDHCPNGRHRKPFLGQENFAQHL